MTTVKRKKSNEGWYEPARHLSAEEMFFSIYVVKINGKTYTCYSNKFKKAFEKDRLFRVLGKND